MPIQLVCLPSKQSTGWVAGSKVVYSFPPYPPFRGGPSSLTFTLTRSHEGTTLCKATCTDAQTYSRSNTGTCKQSLHLAGKSPCVFSMSSCRQATLCFQPVMFCVSGSYFKGCHAVHVQGSCIPLLQVPCCACIGFMYKAKVEVCACSKQRAAAILHIQLGAIDSARKVRYCISSVCSKSTQERDVLSLPGEIPHCFALNNFCAEWKPKSWDSICTAFTACLRKPTVVLHALLHHDQYNALNRHWHCLHAGNKQWHL